MTLKVLAHNQLPTKLPLMHTLVFYLALKVLDAPGWLWGVMGTILVLLWIATLCRLYAEKRVPASELIKED